MSEINFLLSSYSGGELIIMLVAVLLAVVAILRGWDYVWGKVKEYFGMKNKDEQWHDKVSGKLDKIEELQRSIEEVKASAQERGERLKKVEEYTQKDYAREDKMEANIAEIKDSLKQVTNRLQNDTRYEFIEAHQRYCNELHSISYLSKEALSKKYEDYKADGGNSFVDDLWNDIKALETTNYEGDPDGR